MRRGAVGVMWWSPRMGWCDAMCMRPVWCGVVWHGVVQHGALQCSAMRSGVLLRAAVCVVWWCSGATRCGVVPCCAARHGVAQVRTAW